MSDDLADLLDEGEMKRPKPIERNTKENKSSFLDLIKSTQPKAIEDSASPHGKVEPNKNKGRNLLDRESFSSTEEVFVPKVAAFTISNNPKKEALSPMRESPREYTPKILSPKQKPMIPESPVQNQRVANIITDNNLNNKPQAYSKNDNNNEEIAKLRQIIQEDKVRYESLLNEERDRRAQKVEEYHKDMDQLRLKYSEEMSLVTKLHIEKEAQLNEEIARLKTALSYELEQERNRQRNSYQKELDLRIISHKVELDTQKRQYERQIEEVKSQITHQMELGTLTTRFEASQRQIADLAMKLQQEKDKALEMDKSAFQSKEKYLKEYEEKLKEMDNNIIKEKAAIQRERHDMELNFLQRKKDTQEEKTRMEKEIVRLQQLQNSLKTIEFQSKEKNDKDSIGLVYKENELKLKMETFESNYQVKMNEMNFQKKTFEEEKKFFEKYKEEAFKAIEVKQYNLDQNKKSFYEEEKNLKERIKALQEKELYITEHVDEFQRIKEVIATKEARILKEQNEMANTVHRINQSIIALDDRKRESEKESENIARLYQAIETQRINLDTERMNIEQEKAEVKMKMQAVDNLRVKYVTSNANLAQTAFEANNQEFSKTFQAVNNYQNMSSMKPMNDYKESNSLNNSRREDGLGENGIKTLDGMSRPCLNADEYFHNLKARIENKKYIPEHNNAFGSYLIQEKEFLKKSNEDLSNHVKKTYDYMNHNYNVAMNPSLNQ